MSFQNEIVLLSGKQGAGKSTLKTALLENPMLEEMFEFRHEIRFADPIYQVHNFARDYIRECGVDAPDKDGEMLQILGAYFRKKYGPDFFVNIVKGRIKAALQTHDTGNNLFIIEDCRYPNELYGISNLACSFRLVAPEGVRKPRTESWRDNTNHESEIALDSTPLSHFTAVFDTEVTCRENVLEAAVATIQKRYMGGYTIKMEDL